MPSVLGALLDSLVVLAATGSLAAVLESMLFVIFLSLIVTAPGCFLGLASWVETEVEAVGVETGVESGVEVGGETVVESGVKVGGETLIAFTAAADFAFFLFFFFFGAGELGSSSLFSTDEEREERPEEGPSSLSPSSFFFASPCPPLASSDASAPSEPLEFE
jgi:hypothetical protein